MQIMEKDDRFTQIRKDFRNKRDRSKLLLPEPGEITLEMIPILFMKEYYKHTERTAAN